MISGNIQRILSNFYSFPLGVLRFIKPYRVLAMVSEDLLLRWGVYNYKLMGDTDIISVYSRDSLFEYPVLVISLN